MTELMQNLFAFGMPGGFEWIIILVIAVLIFGRRLPEIARKAGKSMSAFKKGVKEGKEEVSNAMNIEDDDKDENDKIEPPDDTFGSQL